jgi:hypothetical protein
VDVFWKGTDGQRWHGFYDTGGGWFGPFPMGGSIGVWS